MDCRLSDEVLQSYKMSILLEVKIKGEDKLIEFQRFDGTAIERYCSTCNKWKEESVEFFYLKNKLHPEKGFSSKCKLCRCEYALIWKKDNVEKRRESDRKRNARPDRKLYNKEKNNLYRKNGKREEWVNDNREKLKVYNANHTDHKITEKEWESCLECFDWSCAYCGYTYEEHIQKEGQQLHREHVNHDGNDYIDNCVPACRTCNTSKHDKDFKEWYNADNPNYTKRRLNRIVKWVSGDWMNWTE